MLLNNRLYLGQISYKGQWYGGQQSAIIDQDLWDQVHARSANRHSQRAARKPSVTSHALLCGLLYNAAGERMTPTYTRKRTKTYRYYVCRSEIRFGGARGNPDTRLPADEIEGAVVAQILTVLTSPEAIAAVIRHIKQAELPIDEARAVMALGRLVTIWPQLFPAERHRITRLLIERIDLVNRPQDCGIRISWHALGWRELIGESAPQAIGSELLEVDR